MERIRKVCVIGGGAIGTAMAQTISIIDGVEEILILERWPKVVGEINRGENRTFLRGIKLNPKIKADNLIFHRAKDADLIIVATPTSGVREAVSGLTPCYGGQPVITLNKGMEAKTQQLSHEIIRGLGDGKINHLHISGPAIGDELAKGSFTENSIASFNLELASEIGRQLKMENLRLLPTDDLIGVELGGVFKNILAIMMGMAESLKLPENTQGTLFC